jgi:hypothetical protein
MIWRGWGGQHANTPHTHDFTGQTKLNPSKQLQQGRGSRCRCYTRAALRRDGHPPHTRQRKSVNNMPRRRSPIALSAGGLLLALLLAGCCLPQGARAQNRRAASLFSRMKQQKGEPAAEAEPVAAAEPEEEEGGIRFERRSLAMEDAPGFSSVFDADLKMIKWVLGVCVYVCVRVCVRVVVVSYRDFHHAHHEQ